MDKVALVLSMITAAVVGGCVWNFVWKFFYGEKPYPGEEEAGRAKEKKQDEIRNTPAADLVVADELRADAAGIAGRAKQRLRDRAGKIISRLNGTGDIDGGGS
jgi:hypothetical protein